MNKYSKLSLIGALLSIPLSLSALSVQDVMGDGQNMYPRKLGAMEIVNLRLNTSWGWWKFMLDGEPVYIDKIALDGLKENDFEKFLHGTELANITPLKRETPAYVDITQSYKDRMSRLRDILFAQPLHQEYYRTLYLNYVYDMEKGGFHVRLDSEIPLDYTPNGRPYEDAITIGEDMTKHFVDGTVENALGKWVKYEPEIFIPMENKELALKFEERIPHEGEFEFYIQYRYNETPNPTHYTLTDMILLYQPTMQVVWSAAKGDYSMEVSRDK